MCFLDLDTKGRSTAGCVHPASSPSIQKVFPWRKGSRERHFKVRFCTVGESTGAASGSERVGVKWWHPSSKGRERGGESKNMKSSKLRGSTPL